MESSNIIRFPGCIQHQFKNLLLHVQSSSEPQAHLTPGLREELNAFEELVGLFVNKGLAMRQKII